MEAALESIRQITYECIDYIEQNAVWLGIVGLAVLILLLLFGGLAAAGSRRKQRRMLRRIDKKVALLTEAQEADATVRLSIAEDVAAMRAASEIAAKEAAQDPHAYEKTVETFFLDTQVETCEAVSEEAEKPVAAESPVEETPVEAVSAEETPVEAPAVEAIPAEEPAAESETIDLSELQKALLKGPEETAAADAGEAAESLPGSIVARGKSGRLYTREELENQIRK